MTPPSERTPTTPSTLRARPLLILSGAILGLAVAWLFSLVSGIPLPLWEAVTAMILGAVLGFSASLPPSPSKPSRNV
ncbi:hypothetical protein [Thermoflexus sp.]|uniref:hypothetical protein n=1 Tax=Thermoflexus sp. TaxID=1969742 RepID=UPI001771BC63|nr:hypothetical protein [Thermoflexus sp.]